MFDPKLLRITLQPKQREALAVSERTSVTFYGGAKGGGKSHLIRARELKRRMQYPGSTGLIVRKTYPELLANHIRKFFLEYPQTASWYNKAEKAIYWPNGSVTNFSYLQHTDDVYTYQGREFDDISIDEITQHSEEVFKILRTSNRTTNPDLTPSMMLTGNPGGLGHAWVKRIFVTRDFLPDETPEDFAFVQAKVWDNQALMSADPSYLKKLQDLPAHLRKAYLEGDWDIFEGQFFTEWRKDRHVIEPFTIPPAWQHMAGHDFGYAKPCACIWGAIDFDGRLWVYRELYGAGLTEGEQAKRIAQLSQHDNLEHLIIDPSTFNKVKDESCIADAFLKEGLPVQRGNNDRISGWNRIRQYLKDGPACEFHRKLGWKTCPMMHVFTPCQNLIRTLPEAIFDDIKVEDLDTDGEDHALDATRYLAMVAPAKAQQALEIVGWQEGLGGVKIPIYTIN
jgi:phage terminase large subunit